MGKFVNRKIRRRLQNGEIVEETAEVEVTPEVEETAEVEESVSDDDATEISVAEVVQLLAKYAGIELPAEVDTAKELRIALETMTAQAESMEDAPPEMVDAMPVEEMAPTMLRLALRSTRKRLADAVKREQAHRKIRLSKAKASFEAVLNEAVANAVITEADKQSFMNAGAKCGYDRVIIRHLKNAQPSMPAYKTGPQYRQLSHTGHARMPNSRYVPTDERCKEIADKW